MYKRDTIAIELAPSSAWRSPLSFLSAEFVNWMTRIDWRTKLPLTYIYIDMVFMFQNVLVFMVLFLILTVSFIIGFRSIFWYYDSSTRRYAETPLHPSTEAEGYFGTYVDKKFLCGLTVKKHSSCWSRPYSAPSELTISGHVLERYITNIAAGLYTLYIASALNQSWIAQFPV